MAPQGSSNGLVRWLVGGLVGGAILLGLLIGAYAIGYHRGHEKATKVAPQPTTAPATTAPVTTAPAGTTLAARGEQLFAADACSSCHSLAGAAGVGPALNGLAGRQVALADGTSVAADAAYLERSLTDPDAQIRKGFSPGVMPGATARLDLSSKPQDVAALVAFIEARR